MDHRSGWKRSPRSSAYPVKKVVDPNPKWEITPVCLCQRQAPLELEPGKTAIEIEGIAELIPTLKLVHQSIELGDFDDLF